MNDLMTRADISNLERLIRKQERVCLTALDQREAELKADFERHIAAVYYYDQDEVWKKAYTEANEIAQQAKAQIAARCEEMGIPEEFAPTLDVHWYRRGENAVKDRRDELRRKAMAEIAALKKSGRTQVEIWSLNAQTKLASKTLTSEAAKTFLDEMPSTTELMPKLEYQHVTSLLEDSRKR